MLHVSALAHCELLGYISRVLRRWGRRRGKKANNFMLYEPRVWAAREMSRGLERRPKWKRKHRNVTHFGLLERCSLLWCAYALYSTLIARYAAVVMNGMKEDHDEWEKRGWRVETRSLSEWGLNSFTNYHDMSCYKHTKKIYSCWWAGYLTYVSLADDGRQIGFTMNRKKTSSVSSHQIGKI